MKLTDDDVDFLGSCFPSLSLDKSKSEITGILSFEASYDSESNQFLILGSGIQNSIGGIILKGKYSINIQLDVPTARLPALHLDPKEVEISPERHINTNCTGCLCGPAEEMRYAQTQISLQTFISNLVIPFLYGQVYYDQYKCWPWGEYSHGAAGVLESYMNNNGISLEGCIKRLQEDSSWKTIRTLLQQKWDIKGHTPCFCKRHDHIRRCHPDAWKALNRMRNDIKKNRINIDKIEKK